MKNTSKIFFFIMFVFTVSFTVSCQKTSDGENTSQTPPTLAQPAPQEQPTEPRSPTDTPDDASPVSSPAGSAESVAIPIAQVSSLGIGGLPAWPGTLEQLNQLVAESRQARLYPNPNPGNYLRRAPWYYGGGCYSKAAHVSALAEKAGFPRAGKVFAFGGWATLRFKSKYMPGGAAWWSYHVVAAYHIGPQVYVLDPLVSPEQAMTVEDWIKALAPRPEKISLAYCDQNIYSPTDRCLGGNRDGAFTGHLEDMLKREYQSLEKLGYDPDTVL